MSETADQSSRRPVLAVAVVAVVLVVIAVIVGMLMTNPGPGGTAVPSSELTETPAATTGPSGSDTPDDEGGDMTPGSTFGAFLPESMGGEEAIDELGDRIAVVAKRNNKTVEELSDLLLRDRSAQISPEGFIVYKDSFDNAE
ncbi:hypothetical protein [Microbacterium foliorum]|jgi:hypothetical protein|uniref:hypothetical protein n=1 Tax=Microbacterium foliorum TaxID=104336 RepID=UPI001DA7D9B6|nr:hypothetical protein [Microbacterium foliorum]CAH0182918.1 hypothetical protein SRABI44_01493 [Microbacterium foliorum]CAH0217313.1 hypothetical protein SRABI03_02379 [Microbacterium foliorum]